MGVRTPSAQGLMDLSLPPAAGGEGGFGHPRNQTLTTCDTLACQRRPVSHVVMVRGFSVPMVARSVNDWLVAARVDLRMIV